MILYLFDRKSISCGDFFYMIIGKRVEWNYLLVHSWPLSTELDALMYNNEGKYQIFTHQLVSNYFPLEI